MAGLYIIWLIPVLVIFFSALVDKIVVGIRYKRISYGVCLLASVALTILSAVVSRYIHWLYPSTTHVLGYNVPDIKTTLIIILSIIIGAAGRYIIYRLYFKADSARLWWATFLAGFITTVLYLLTLWIIIQ